MQALQALLTIGVTGTKGKTSTVHFTAQLMEHAGRRVALDSTVSCRFLSQTVEPCRTKEDVQNLMQLSCHYAVECVVLEVTSRVAVLAPLDSVCEYDCAVFTTLDKEHLNYHRSLRNYLAAKQRLFAAVNPQHDSGSPKWVVLNRDDPAWEAMHAAARPGVGVATYSANPSRPPAVSEWDCTAENIVHRDAGTVFDLQLPGRLIRGCETPLHGDFNVRNVLAAVACASLYGVPADTIVDGMTRLVPPPGRFEIVQRAAVGAPWIVIDYAHTRGSLEAALLAARAVAPGGRVLCVFGCGGDCYKGKRPEMGRVAAALANRVVITSDNPRKEDPLKIIGEIRRGIPSSDRDRITIEPDRRRAIELAVGGASQDDIVLIAGKGNEETQILGDVEEPFSDARVALAALHARRVDKDPAVDRGQSRR